MDVLDALAARRSIRRFDGRPVPVAALARLAEAGTWAPAPHHTRPWRFVNVASTAGRRRLGRAMGERWRRDLARDGVTQEKIEALLERSRRQQMEAPALLLACLSPEGRRAWPDRRRRQSEWAMSVQSVGAALQNVMLAAHALGLATFWISAPIFCPETARRALNLPDDWEPQALIAVGYPSADYVPRPRPPFERDFLLER